MSDLNQNELWAKVNVIKRRVRVGLGTTLSHEFRSTQVYQAYTGLCGEAQMAHDDQALEEGIARNISTSYKKVLPPRLRPIAGSISG